MSCHGQKVGDDRRMWKKQHFHWSKYRCLLLKGSSKNQKRAPSSVLKNLDNLGDLAGLATEDAEKELLKLLQILNAMPQGTPSDAKKLSAKFAESLGL